MKNFYKVTFVIKPAGNGRLLDGNIFGGEHFTGAFDSVVIQVIDGRPLRHAAEIAAEILRIHTRDFRQHVQTDITVVVF